MCVLHTLAPRCPGLLTFFWAHLHSHPLQCSAAPPTSSHLPSFPNSVLDYLGLPKRSSRRAGSEDLARGGCLSTPVGGASDCTPAPAPGSGLHSTHGGIFSSPLFIVFKIVRPTVVNLCPMLSLCLFCVLSCLLWKGHVIL